MSGAGITAQPSHNSLGFLVLVVFSIFVLVPASTLPVGMCRIQQVQLSEVFLLRLTCFWLSDTASAANKTYLLPSSQYSCSQSWILLLWDLLLALNFSPLFSALSWICSSPWSSVSISATVGLGLRELWNFDQKNPLLTHLVQIQVFFKERLLPLLLFFNIW